MIGSSKESVGKIWDWQIAKSMIQSDFNPMIGSKPIGFSGSEFSFVVHVSEKQKFRGIEQTRKPTL